MRKGEGGRRKEEGGRAKGGTKDDGKPLRRYLPASSEAGDRAEGRAADEEFDPRRTAGRSLR